MTLKLKIFKTLYSSALILLFASSAWSQLRKDLSLKDFSPGDFRRLNWISVSLQPNEVEKIHNTTGLKLKFASPGISVNGIRTDSGSIELRGASSLAFRRKSFSIKLPHKAIFYLAEDSFRINKFFAVSLNMDRNYIRNAIALEVLPMMDIPVPTHCYSNLLLNDSSGGVYMVYYPPADYAINECGADFLLRRGYKDVIDNTHSKGISKAREGELKRKFRMIYNRILPYYKGATLLTKLSENIDLKGYFDWLIFNYIFQNGDYTDEIFFYWDPAINKFKIMPWDLDDLFQKYPHEGRETRSSQLPDKLLYSLEDKLDVAIANDPVLYDEYLKEFRRFIAEFDSENLRVVLENVYFQVYPFFSDPDIIVQSKYDKYGLTNLNNLKKDMKNIYQTVSDRMVILQSTLKSLGY